LCASYRYCNTLARREARNFYYSFLLLPSDRRQSMVALYAFLRHTDDLADEPGSPDQKTQALAHWRQSLDAALAGSPSGWPGFPALADTVSRHALPANLLHQVIDGVSMDIHPRLFQTFDDLAQYCHLVASVVGLCCLHIWGYQSQGGKAERLAEHCGLALQLTNILRDVGDDARNGRIYLPLDDLERFGVKPEELACSRTPSDQIRELLAYEACRAYRFYEDAALLTPLVDRVGRPVLKTIVGIYRTLLDEIDRREYQVLDRRISLPPWRKAMIATRALWGNTSPTREF
jgi:phytoene synthase